MKKPGIFRAPYTKLTNKTFKNLYQKSIGTAAQRGIQAVAALISDTKMGAKRTVTNQFGRKQAF